MDYPNSKKARKVFLCLFVGSGGQHVPKGLDGEDVEDEETARFEKRREKLRKGKDGKRKNIKDKDWILRKKEVRFSRPSRLHILTETHSSIDTEARKASPETPNTLAASGRPCFDRHIDYWVFDTRSENILVSYGRVCVDAPRPRAHCSV